MQNLIMEKPMNTIKYICLTALLNLSILCSFSTTSAQSSQFDLNDKEQIIDSINHMIMDGHFQPIENMIDNLIMSKLKINHVSLLEEVYHSIGKNKNISEELLNDWCAKSSHHSPLVFRAIYLTTTGWKARGSGYAYTVSDKKYSFFKNKLRLAKIDLEKAYEYEPNDPIISVEMIKVCRGLCLPREEMEKWFERGIKADNHLLSIYEQKLIYISPKWHGSHQEYYSYALSLYNNPNHTKEDFSDVLILDSLFWIFFRPTTRKLYNNELSLKNVITVANNCMKRHPGSDYVEIKKNKILGSLHYFNSEYVQAEKSFSDMTKLNPKNHWAWFMLGQMYYKNLDKPKESIAYFNKAIELQDTEAWYYRERGWASLRAGLFSQCYDDLSKAVEGGYRSDSVVKTRELCQKLYKLSMKKE